MPKKALRWRYDVFTTAIDIFILFCVDIPYFPFFFFFFRSIEVCVFFFKFDLMLVAKLSFLHHFHHDIYLPPFFMCVLFYELSISPCIAINKYLVIHYTNDEPTIHLKETERERKVLYTCFISTLSHYHFLLLLFVFFHYSGCCSRPPWIETPWIYIHGPNNKTKTKRKMKK